MQGVWRNRLIFSGADPGRDYAAEAGCFEFLNKATEPAFVAGKGRNQRLRHRWSD